MSLYCFGKVLPSLSVSQLLEGVCCRVVVPDDGDAKELEKESALEGDGSLFSIADWEGGVDATHLWNEGMGCGKGSPLYIATEKIVRCERIHGGGIAFVDGGIERVFHGTSAECLEFILAELGKPWDTIGNTLFIWRNR